MQDVLCFGAPNEELRLTFRLRSGRMVWMTGFYFDGTYDGLLEGQPNVQLNKILIDAAREKAEKLFHLSI